MRTHECPAPGCTVEVRSDRLACLTHWRLIPQTAQMTLNREFRQHFGERSYFEARAACLRSLGVPEDEIADLNGGVPAVPSMPGRPGVRIAP